MRRDGQAAIGLGRALRRSSTCRRGRPTPRPTSRCAASSRPRCRSANEVSIVEGRMLQFGTNEVIVGRGAAAVRGPDGGQRDRVGPEHAGRSSACSKPTAAWPRPRSGATRACCRAPTAAATRTRRCSRGWTRPRAFDTFRDWLTANPQLNVQVRRETEYYAQQSRALSCLIRGHRVRHCRADGHRRGVRRDPHHVYGGVDALARDRDAARARVQRDVGGGVGAGRIARARRDRRRDRRHRRLPGLQRLPDLDDELLRRSARWRSRSR